LERPQPLVLPWRSGDAAVAAELDTGVFKSPADSLKKQETRDVDRALKTGKRGNPYARTSIQII
jgi:hypothetical protein